MQRFTTKKSTKLVLAAALFGFSSQRYFAAGIKTDTKNARLSLRLDAP